MNLNLKKYSKNLLFIPLGGSNEIGMNLNLYHLDGKWIMVDCGVGFAYDIPGVDILTPDISFIMERKKDLLGLIVTHIHEDHLGAVQYLWEKLGCKIYTSRLAANFLRAKLQENNIDKKVPIEIIDGSKVLKLEPFSIEFIGLTHSVPEMNALIIKTSEGNIFHTGDWKFDDNPVVGEVSQLEKLNNFLKEEEILALICDSTNALNEGHSGSEGALYESLKSLMKDRKGLIGVTTFASNIARMYTIARLAKDLNRKVVLAGFSLHRIFQVGQKSGYFNEEFDFISDKEMKFYNKNELLIISTGCQGEPLAATKKIATDTHPTIKFREGDLMIFSSKIIPGNEKKIYSLFDDLAKKNIDVYTEEDHFVHVSGHPSRDELREMYNITKPKIAIPVHGEFIHTKNHADLAKECGVQKTIQVENGSVVILSHKNYKESSIIGNVKNGYKCIDGKQIIDLDSPIIKDRNKLKSSGIVIFTAVLNNLFEIKSEMQLDCYGSYDLNNDKEIIKEVKQEISKLILLKKKELKLHGNSVSKFFSKKSKKKNNNSLLANELKAAIKSKLLTIFKDLTGKKPLININIIII